ncbi:MAG: CaiB/BaiF CoA-transferase family protein [Actinomycetes bacterium]
MTDQAKPLSGLKVADFSRVLAGPYATQRLADLGAEVVKVERPGAGDETRTWGPPFEAGVASYFRSVNRGKRSIAVDLVGEEGKSVAADLCCWSDVVIHNFLPEAAARMGLDGDSLLRLDPGLIVCSVSGFGSARSPAGRPGYDLIVQAESGLMSITGERDGEPQKVGVAIVDVLTGLEAATAVLAAVIERRASGHGAVIEVSLLDSAFAGLVNVAQAALATGSDPGRYGNAHPSIVPYESFTGADGHFVVAAANDGLWQRMCAAIGADDLAADARYATNPDRVSNRDLLIPELNSRFSRHPVAEWIERLELAGVPCGRVLGVQAGLAAADAAGQPATIALDGAGRVVGPPARFSGGRMSAVTGPPSLGQHTDEILEDLGYTRERIARLRQSGAVA